jgi:hypothetical protein
MPRNNGRSYKVSNWNLFYLQVYANAAIKHKGDSNDTIRNFSWRWVIINSPLLYP